MVPILENNPLNVREKMLKLLKIKVISCPLPSHQSNQLLLLGLAHIITPPTSLPRLSRQTQPI